MSEILVISNSSLCKNDFLTKVKKLCRAGIWGFVLREKELDAYQYKILLKNVSEICALSGVKIFAHSNIDAAIELGVKHIHLTLADLSKFQKDIFHFDTVLAPVHSVEEAKFAVFNKANFLLASHMFYTKCKPLLTPKGTGLIKEIKTLFNVPVFGLGGINCANFSEVLNAGADGIAIMSSAMECEDEYELVKNLKIF